MFLTIYTVLFIELPTKSGGELYKKAWNSSDYGSAADIYLIDLLYKEWEFKYSNTHINDTSSLFISKSWIFLLFRRFYIYLLRTNIKAA